MGRHPAQGLVSVVSHGEATEREAPGIEAQLGIALDLERQADVVGRRGDLSGSTWARWSAAAKRASLPNGADRGSADGERREHRQAARRSQPDDRHVIVRVVGEA